MHSPLYRDQRSVAVAVSDGPFLGPNLKRVKLIVSSPPAPDNPQASDGTLVQGADTSTTGVKATYTVPAGVQGTLDSATMQETTGTTVVANLQLTRGGTTVNLAIFTKSGLFTGPVPLKAGDVVVWNVTTAVALSITDFAINVSTDKVPSRVTLSFIGAAVLDQGITINAGTLPLVLQSDHIGKAFGEEIRAIASTSGVSLGVVDIFHG